MKKLNEKVIAGLLSGMLLLFGMAMPAKVEAAYRVWPKTISWSELETMYQNYLGTPKNETPANAPATPANQTATPTNQAATPANQTATPANQAATPANQTATPTNAPAKPANPSVTPSSTGNQQKNGYILDLPGLADKEKWLFDQVNMERQKQGLAPLQWEPTLNKLARMKSQDMVDKGYFAHQSPTYGSAVDMMARAGIQMRTSGENLAVNSRVESAHYMLMDSPGHRANILNGNFTHVGIGIVKTASGGVMITQMFIGK